MSDKDSVRVLIVDDHPMIRHGLQSVLSAADGIDCVGAAASGHEAIRMCNTLQPDIVLMDMAMPDIDGAAATKAIRESHPNTQVIVLTSFYDPGLVQRAIEAGARGYLLKTTNTPELLGAIAAVKSGMHMLSPEAAAALSQAKTQNPVGADLTSRELEILGLMAKGMSNSSIAAALFITPPTVKFHITHVLEKLHAANRTEAVLIAIRHKLVPDA